MKSERNYGIDLLRLVLMFMVCMLHILGTGGVLAASPADSTSHKIFLLAQVFCCCAVDGFALISGYTAKNRPQKYHKIIEMWFQVWFYSFALTLIFTLVGIDLGWGWSSFIRRLLPLTHNRFWYFSAYFALFFVSPAINRFVFALDESSAKNALFIAFTLFSVIGSVADSFETNLGYSAFWIMLLYTMGLLAKQIRLFENKSTSALVALWLCCNLITWGGCLVYGEDSHWSSYISPTVVLSAFTLVILFSRIPLKGTVIRKAAPLAFGVYLFQMSPVVWHKILTGSLAFAAEKPLPLGLGYVAAYSALLFICGLTVEFFRSTLARLLKIDLLSQKIASALERALFKSTALSK